MLLNEFFARVETAFDSLVVFHSSWDDLLVGHVQNSSDFSFYCFDVVVSKHLTFGQDLFSCTGSYLNKNIYFFVHVHQDVRERLIYVQTSFLCLYSPLLSVTIAIISHRQGFNSELLDDL